MAHNQTPRGGASPSRIPAPPAKLLRPSSREVQESDGPTLLPSPMKMVNVNTSLVNRPKAAVKSSPMSTADPAEHEVVRTTANASGQGLPQGGKTPAQKAPSKRDAGPSTKLSPAPSKQSPAQLPRVASISAGKRLSGEGVEGLMERRGSVGERRSLDGSQESDLKLDLRSQDLKVLRPSLIGLSKRLEYVYLRHNRLHSFDGLEALTNMKILDASFNDLGDSCLPQLESLQSLRQLFLAGNRLQSLSGLPQLADLEFLSVSSNALTSLAMRSQPRLEVFAASKNRIASLQDFPHLPTLEVLRLEGNEFLSRPHARAIATILAGPTLRKLDDEVITEEDHKRSLDLPPHIIPCLRAGWEVGESAALDASSSDCVFGLRPDHVEDSLADFLTKQRSQRAPPGVKLLGLRIEDPKEGEHCRCQVAFAGNTQHLTLKQAWFRGPRHGYSYRRISGVDDTVYEPQPEDVGLCLKVECTPVYKGTEYPPIFVISREVVAGDRIPKVQTIDVSKQAVEGSTLLGSVGVAWCGAKPGNSLISWQRVTPSGEVQTISGAKQSEYEAAAEDVRCKLRFSYQPVSDEGKIGAAQFAETLPVKAAPPKVTGVEIVGQAVVKKRLVGRGVYAGGKEGVSRFEWLREREGAVEPATQPNKAAEYLITQADLGARLHFKYFPVNLTGDEGEPQSAHTEPVKQAPPSATKLRIIGDVIEAGTLSVEADYIHADESLSSIQWFGAQERVIAGQKIDERKLTWVPLGGETKAKVFVAPAEAGGLFLIAKLTPRRSEEAGSPAYVSTDRAVEMIPPAAQDVTVSGAFKEGQKLTASYMYEGGVEGRSEYAWYSLKDEDDVGELIAGSNGRLEYVLRPEDVGRHVAFQCTPVRSDGKRGAAQKFVGSTRIAGGPPRIKNLRVVGSASEAMQLRAEEDYSGGMEGSSRYQWHLLRKDGKQEAIEGATRPMYTVQERDVGAMVSVSCTPVRSDGVEGDPVVSSPRGPILAGPPQCTSLTILGEPIEGQILSYDAKYTGGKVGASTVEWTRVDANANETLVSKQDAIRLRKEDIGCRLRLLYTPVRKDALAGQPVSMLSDVVQQGEPLGLRLTLPDLPLEDDELEPRAVYFGGEEGSSEWQWFQCSGNPKTDEAWEPIAKTRKYTPRLADVGQYLIVSWTPVRCDGKRGQPLTAFTANRVGAAPPQARAVKVLQIEEGVYVGSAKYHGGVEGASIKQWHRLMEAGDLIAIPDATSSLYRTGEDDYFGKLVFAYTPFRADGERGRTAFSVPGGTIYPELPGLGRLTISGKVAEGQILTALEDLPQEEKQQEAWRRFKKEIKYQWSRSSLGSDENFSPLPNQRSVSYKVRLDDVGRRLKCECSVVDIFGRSAPLVEAVTDVVRAAEPKMERLQVDGRGFHTSTYAVRGTYSGGREGSSAIQWFRSSGPRLSGELTPIPGATGPVYEAQLDDIGHCLAVRYTPVRSDGCIGETATVFTPPIVVDPDTAKDVQSILDGGAAKFETQSGSERRVVDVNRKRIKVVRPGASKTSFSTVEVKGNYAPPFRVELFGDDPHRLKIVIDHENDVELVVHTRHTRDVIALAVRGFAQRS